MIKPLTIWIPTYRRPRALAALLANLQQVGLIQLAEIVVSDNDPEGPLAAAFARGEAPLPHEVVYRCNLANLSAGVNFLRGFEACRTPWIMVVGDDDLFAPNAANELEGLLAQLSDGVIAVKFDSTLFGMQSCCNVSDLAEYVDQLDSRCYADAFNNLCLVSNWLFRCDCCLPHLASAYLGYSSKLSHLFPVLRACAYEGGQLFFSSSQPVMHGTTEASSWPKAATWYEMIITLTTFTGFIDPVNRKALLRLLLHSDWRRTIAKCLRVHQYYGQRDVGVNAWRVHAHLALCSFTYCWVLLLFLPILLFPPERLPRRILKQLGDPGTIERW